jgi:hypothetical protein
MEIKELIRIFEENFLEYSRLLRKLNKENPQESTSRFLPDSEISIAQLTSLETEIIELRLKKILKEEHPYIPQINLEKLNHNSAFDSLPLIQICDQFLRQKKEVLKLLYSLPTENWDRTGVHEMEGHVAFKELIRRMIIKDKQILGNFKSTLKVH